MLVHGHDARVVGHEAAGLEAGADEGLDLALLDGRARGQPLLDEGEGLVLGHHGVARGAVVQLLLLRRPAGLEHLDEVGGGDHLGPRGAHHLHRARVDAAHVGDGRARAVLHGHALHGGEVRLQQALQLFPRAVQHRGTGRAAQRVGLDGVQDAHGLARAGDEVEPAAGADLALVEPDHAARDRVAAAEVVEQPPVDPLLGQGLLYSREVHRTASRPRL